MNDNSNSGEMRFGGNFDDGGFGNFVRQMLTQIEQENQETNVVFRVGLDDKSGQAFVSIQVSSPEVNITPNHALEVAYALIQAAYRAKSDQVWHKIMRERLADNVGNVRRFTPEDKGMLRTLVQEEYEPAEAADRVNEEGADDDDGEEGE